MIVLLIFLFFFFNSVRIFGQTLHLVDSAELVRVVIAQFTLVQAIYEWINEWTNEWANEQTNKQVDEQTNNLVESFRSQNHICVHLNPPVRFSWNSPHLKIKALPTRPRVSKLKAVILCSHEFQSPGFPQQALLAHIPPASVHSESFWQTEMLATQQLHRVTPGDGSDVNLSPGALWCPLVAALIPI